jgi:hypothetical protein
MSASSSRVISTSRMWAPGWSPARPAFPLADAAGPLLPVAEMGDVDGRDRDADELAARAADHLAVRDVLAQVLADFPPQDVLESGQVTVDAAGHRRLVAPPGASCLLRASAPPGRLGTTMAVVR